TLSQRANNAIVATQTASTFFIMPAIFAGHVAQLKMPRLDAYGQLKKLHPDNKRKQVSHESIYTCIYAQPRGELKKELVSCLRM
ncbi:hypothetical protein NFX52_30775, partial [Acidovorax facilis]|nr:hypothetical protein [Acidovorax facilis]